MKSPARGLHAGFTGGVYRRGLQAGFTGGDYTGIARGFYTGFTLHTPAMAGFAGVYFAGVFFARCDTPG